MGKQVNLFGFGNQGKSPVVTAQERVNCYVEPQKEKDKGAIAIYGVPGKVLFSNLGASPSLSKRAIGNYLYSVNRDTLYKIDNNGNYVVVGTLSTINGSVVMSDNGTQLMIVDGLYGYIYNTATGVFAQITDPDFPANPTYVTYLDTYFIIVCLDSKRFYISSQNDGTGWAALDVASAESQPDNNVAILSYNSQLVVFGERSTEFWGNTGALDFPFGRVQGSSNQWGLAAKFSLVEYDGSVAGLFRNREGGLIAGKMIQNQPNRISNPEVEYEWKTYSQVGDATGISYVVSGHPMYQVNFPTQGVTWLFDGLSGAWSKLKSYGINRDKAERGIFYLGKQLVSDYSNGNIYRLDETVYTDNGNPIEMELIGRHVSKDEKKITIDHIQLMMETGIGLNTGQGSDPKIMLQASKDRGRSYGVELWRDIGKIGDTKRRVRWGGLGSAIDFTIKVRITDPIKRVIIGAVMDVREGI